MKHPWAHVIIVSTQLCISQRIGRHLVHYIQSWYLTCNQRTTPPVEYSKHVFLSICKLSLVAAVLACVKGSAGIKLLKMNEVGDLKK